MKASVSDDGLIQEKFGLYLSLGFRTPLCSFSKVKHWFDQWPWRVVSGTGMGPLYLAWEIIWDEHKQWGMMDSSQLNKAVWEAEPERLVVMLKKITAGEEAAGKERI